MTEDRTEYLRGIVSILFAVVLGLSIEQYRDLLNPVNWEPFLALLTIHISIVFSWIGYHDLLLNYSYKDSIWSLFRVLNDVAIVILYAFLIYIAVEVGTGTKVSLLYLEWEPTVIYLFGFCLVYSLYIINDIFVTFDVDISTINDDGAVAYILWNFLFFVIFVAFFVAICITSVRSWVIPLSVLLLVILYRHVIFSQTYGYSIRAINKEVISSYREKVCSELRQERKR